MSAAVHENKRQNYSRIRNGNELNCHIGQKNISFCPVLLIIQIIIVYCC